MIAPSSAIHTSACRRLTESSAMGMSQPFSRPTVNLRGMDETHDYSEGWTGRQEIRALLLAQNGFECLGGQYLLGPPFDLRWTRLRHANFGPLGQGAEFDLQF